VKRLFVLGAALGLVLVACNEPKASLVDTGWTFFGYSSNEGGTVQVLPDTNPTIAFDESTVSGNDGCNDFSGSYESSGGNTIEIGPLASTQKACDPAVMEQADIILGILSRAVLYDKDGAQLFIRDEQARFVAYDEAVDE
jgi:heat shock protein HslJ